MAPTRGCRASSTKRAASTGSPSWSGCTPTLAKKLSCLSARPSTLGKPASSTLMHRAWVTPFACISSRISPSFPSNSGKSRWQCESTRPGKEGGNAPRLAAERDFRDQLLLPDVISDPAGRACEEQIEAPALQPADEIHQGHSLDCLGERDRIETGPPDSLDESAPVGLACGGLERREGRPTDRGEGGFRALDPLLLQPRQHSLDFRQGKRESQTAAAYGRKPPVGLRSDQEKHRCRRRFLEALEEGVLGI